VRSNLMFILDDSGSMSSDYMPDDAPTRNVCFGSAADNRLFYDPTLSYPTPVNADGTSMANAVFSSAWRDGFKTSAGSDNLTDNHPRTADLAGEQISETRTVGDKVTCGNKNSKDCRVPSTTSSTSKDGSTTTQTQWARLAAAGSSSCSKQSNSCALQSTTTKTVSAPGGKFLWATRKPGAASSSCNAADFDVVRYSSALSAAQTSNYANWYAYHRTRMLAMRSSAGRAFGQIDPSRFRVGFSTIHNSSTSDGTEFLNVRDFDSGTQKANFFSRLYTTTPSGSTPLRPALERAGKYFANKLSGQADPVQYSCQRNFTILSTDGYWNSGDEGSGYSPKKLDGTTAIGNPDSGTGVARPLRDEVNGSGVANTLADIAMYFYQTDLRSSALGNCSGAISGQDVCDNNVPSDGGKDTAAYQHMTTITLGLGANGTLNYSKDYETRIGGDFWDIRQGNLTWPDPEIGSTSYSVVERIDDLWHAAVNGRGHYYSAADSVDLANSLVDALSKIEAITGSASSAATSSLTPSAGDDWLFVPLYTTLTWQGTVNAYKIDTATGAILTPSTPVWSAADRMAGQGSRNILFRKTGASNALAAFTYANLSSASLNAPFDNACSGTRPLSQCAALSSAARAKVTGNNLVNYLAGAANYETTAAAPDDQLFRLRTSPLGDIVDGAPVYAQKPPFKYRDSGYAGYVTAQQSRQGVLYVAANDGMLHALKVSQDSSGGTELWAYVPTLVMPNMAVLADTAYDSKHLFFANGAPMIADVQSGGVWRTILVGGLGKGGRGYYALDISDPAAPKSLWEFSDTDLGASFGNPVITKNSAGTWVVVFSSGYNNVSPGDGQGHLYVLDAVTGALLKKISTGVGSTGTPNNLGKINAWVDDDTDNTALRIYGADMLGNVWRFDFDDRLPGADAFLLAQTGTGQPITTKPVLSEVLQGSVKVAVVSVATGRYLGTSDVGDTALQSVYSFKDDLSTSLGPLRSNAGMVKQTLKSDRSGLDSPLPVNWATQAGWYVDLSLSSGERVNVDFEQQFNQLVVASNIPSPTVCSSGGTSWIYYFDIGSGKLLLSYEGDSLVAGITNIVSSTGKLITLVQGVNGKNTARLGVEPGSSTPGTMRRTSWRELME
jgi:type IV pilus assembly protein PilY1